MYQNEKYEHWLLNEVYYDHKRQLHCQLVEYKPYLRASKGNYVTFKYTNGKHVRKSCNEALSRFELTKPVTVTHNYTLDNVGIPSKKVESKKSVSERNAIIYYVDFKAKKLLNIK